MVWIPGGALVAGTPADSLPRVADEEMPGEQVILRGFHIDVYPYPNEEGALPQTNVSQAEATDRCARQNKRLCSELEWERACKGPNNHRYEYGNQYLPERCGTGAAPALRPNGILVGCQSDFGVRDLHGGTWEWTLSPWGRGTRNKLVTVRGGNSTAGELVGRCANAMGRAPDSRSPGVGFRCCAGPVNQADVSLKIVRGRKLESRDAVDGKLAEKVKRSFPEAAYDEIRDPTRFKFERLWVWRPIGNEELHVLGGCSGLGKRPTCGILVARVLYDHAQVLAWSSSGHWLPTVHMDVDPRDLWLFGGDKAGGFRRLVAYQWGRIDVGPKQRRMPKPKRD